MKYKKGMVYTKEMIEKDYEEYENTLRKQFKDSKDNDLFAKAKSMSWNLAMCQELEYRIGNFYSENDDMHYLIDTDDLETNIFNQVEENWIGVNDYNFESENYEKAIEGILIEEYE